MVGGYFMILSTLFYFVANAQAFHSDAKCMYDWHCPYLNSYCARELNLCLCKPTHPVRIPNALCVPALQLGEKCDFSHSCQYLDANSYCHLYKGCVCKDGYRPMRISQYHPVRCGERKESGYWRWPYDDDSDEDDDDDDDDDDEKGIRNDVATPIIVGIVLGSAIVCGWSCAICRLYLRKMEKQRRKHQRRLRRRKPIRPIPVQSTAESLNETECALLPSPSNEISIVSSSIRHSTNRSYDQTEVPLGESRLGDVRESMPLDLHSETATLQLCPDEEPLPGYEGRIKDSPEPDSELPPSYEEVMNESNRQSN